MIFLAAMSRGLKFTWSPVQLGAAVAYTAEIPVWLVAGVGRLLPASVWNALADRLTEPADLARSPFYQYAFTLTP